MCVCVRARARAREARSDFWPAESDFWEMRVLLGFTPVMTFGSFWLFGKTCKILQACIHVLVKLIFRIREKHKFWIISNEYTMRRNWRDEKISTQKILTFQEWVIILRSIVATWTLNHTWFRIMTISYRKPKNLNRLRISLAPTKFYSLQHQLLELDLTRLTFFGVRYVLTYSPNHSSAQDVEHLDHQCDSLWSTEVTYEDHPDVMCYIAKLVRAIEKIRLLALRHRSNNSRNIPQVALKP